MSDIVTPLDIAEMLARWEQMGGDARALPRDPNTGLFVCDATEPPSEITLASYEAGLKVLELRHRAQRGR